MRTAIFVVAISGALAAMGWAQLAAKPTGKTPDGKRSTYEVIINGKVVAKGRLTDKRTKPATVEVKIDGKSVVRTLGAGGSSRTLVLSRDGKLPSFPKGFDAKAFAQYVPEWSPERLKELQAHIAKLDEMMRAHFGPGQNGKWVWPGANFDPYSIKELQKSMEISPEALKKMRDLTDLRIDALKGGSTFVLPGNGLRLVDPTKAAMPMVEFGQDGSYKVLLNGRTLAEGKVDPKESRQVSVAVMDGKYRVEINGKLVAEGSMPAGN